MATLPHSPAADRNKESILERLRGILGEHGSVLEIAAGTGQHAVCFAAALPGWQWQPTDADAAMLPAIAGLVAQSGLANILPPLQLDVTAARWPPSTRRFDAIYCANLLHIAPWDACPALMAGAARQLAPGGTLILYGPFLEESVAPAASNLAFDLSLRARNPAWGLRSLERVAAEAHRAGLVLAQRHGMPANNLLLVFMAA